MDGWLRSGAIVVTASERAARALTGEFNRARQAEGLTAWPEPEIVHWNSFVRTEWERRNGDGRLLLNATQEEAIWAELVSAGEHPAALLEGPRHRLAQLAMEAHGLLCSFAPQYLDQRRRNGWEQDAEVFSGWLTGFEQICRSGGFLSPGRAALELRPLLKKEVGVRPPLLAVGFDRALSVQSELFDAWGRWQQLEHGERAAEIRFFEASDAQSELAGCTRWCREKLAADRNARLLVVTQDAAKRRGEIERAFLGGGVAGNSLPFEFSLGIPLSQVGVAKAAKNLLRWLRGPIEEQEVDWLIGTGMTGSVEEKAALQGTMKALRQHGLQRTQWTLDAFLAQCAGGPGAAWAHRMRQARDRFQKSERGMQGPLEWAGVLPEVLEIAGWPGGRALSSAEYQARDRWTEALEISASLGFDGRRMQGKEFLEALWRTLDGTLYVSESTSAPIQITGAAESAGLEADAIWFLGANEDSWPPRGSTNPLLPAAVEREAGMPHATPHVDWELAHAMTLRLLASAREVNFSYARQTQGTEVRPSRLIAQFAGKAEELAKTPAKGGLATVRFEDRSRVPLEAGQAGGGASVLSNQSQCPFKAFATVRLGAKGWEAAEAGLTPAQRGQLLHSVMHAVWAGAPEGIRSHTDLVRLAGREEFVEKHVRRVFREQMPPGVRDRMPRR
jgi:probable DNA repair protein